MKRNWILMILFTLVMSLIVASCGGNIDSSSSLSKDNSLLTSQTSSSQEDSSLDATSSQSEQNSLAVSSELQDSSSVSSSSSVESVSESLSENSSYYSSESSLSSESSSSEISQSFIDSVDNSNNDSQTQSVSSSSSVLISSSATSSSSSLSSASSSSSSSVLTRSSSSSSSFSSSLSSSSKSSSSSSSVSSSLSKSSSSSSSILSSSSKSSSSSSSVSSSSSKSSSSSSVESKYLLTITYTGAKSNPQTYQAEYKKGDSYSVNTPTVTGYNASQNKVSGVMGQTNVNVEVTYSPISYNIAYDYNGGVKGSSNPTTATYDSAFAPSIPTRAGYKFAGWSISGVNTQTALYGNSSTQATKVYSDLTRCYQLNSSDLDANGNAYWTGTVYFKNLVATSSTVTLKANWTTLDKLSVANDGASVVNNANGILEDCKTLEIANNLSGTFVLSFSYYQDALVNETDLKYTNACSRTGILSISKGGDGEYLTNIRQDGYAFNGTNPAGSLSCSSYTASNNYGDMFYGLAGNNSSVTSTKFAEFVRNSIVTYTIEGQKVGQVGATLKITQTILSLGTTYKNQSITIVYDINLTDGIYYNSGIDFLINAEDANLSMENLSYEIISDDLSFSNVAGSWTTMVSEYKQYAPDQYWTGDFDFTVSYNQSQIGYYAEWGSVCWRTPLVVFYEWGNVGNSVVFRNDWHGWANGNNFVYSNTEYSIGDLVNNETGKCTSYGGNRTKENALLRNATVTVRCVKTANTVYVYQLISTPGSSEVIWINTYKFTTTATKLSFQIVSESSGFTITSEDYSANTKVLANNSIGGLEYGIGTHSFGVLNTRAHIAVPFKVKAGTVVKYKGADNYNWSVLEMKKYVGPYSEASGTANYANSDRLYDTTWMQSSVKSYTVSQDCYLAVNIKDSTDASLSGLDIKSLLQQSFEITFTLDNNLNKNEQVFTSSMLEENSTYGLTTYSGQFGEGDSRCHIAVIPLLKKGTVITFKGGATYNWSVLEMASERVILYDTTWQDTATVTTYTLTRDCYVAINVKYVSGASFNGVDIKSLLYNNIKIEGKCGIVNCENPATHSATEEGDMQSINHRGFSATAPENTMAAYSVSKQKGFTKVECDINFTKDGYGVLLHDGSIDRTSNGSGNIGDINFTTVRGYDFGDWKSATYDNEQMPTVEEFLLQCKNLQLHPYLELKYGTKAQIQRLAMLVRRYGMEDNVTWISFDLNCLTYVRDVSPGARLGYLNGDINQDVINAANSLKTGRNEVFLDINFGCVDTVGEATNRVALCKANNLPLEVWTVNDEQTMKNVYNATGGYVTGFTSDNTIAENVNFG